MSNEDKGKSNKEEGVDFSEVEDFLEEKEEQVEEALEKEEEKIDILEEKKEEIEAQKKEIESKLEEKKAALEETEEKVEEKIEEEKEKEEELKKEESYLEDAKEKAVEIKEEIKEKGFSFSESIGKIKGMFKNVTPPPPKASGKWLKGFYESQYKKLLIIPFLMLLFAFVQIGYQYNATGDFLNRGVELKGGITLTIPEKSYDINELSEILNSGLGGDISVRKISQTKGLLIEASDVEEDALLGKVEEVIGELDPDDYSIEEMGSSLGASFFSEIIKAIIIAFVLMAAVVFITFRVPAPSIAVILAALSDIIITLAIFNMTGLKVGKGGIAAFLMLIGYSVDTDILLSTKVLKSKVGTVMDRVYSAMKTGLTMSITTIVALTVALIFTTSEVIRQIMIILLIGLLVDIINTWIQNVGILRLYLERKARK